MKLRDPAGKLVTFLAVFLLVTLPVSASAQLSAAGTVIAAGKQPQQLPNEAEASYLLQGEGEVELQISCSSPNKECQGKCWTPCNSGNTWYCGSKGAICCQSSAKFCADKCWLDNCPAGTVWVCKSTVAVCESVCTNPSYPNYCGGQCWSNCGSDQYKKYKFACESGKGVCRLDSCISSSYPNKCCEECWSNCGSGYNWVCKSDCKAECVSKCSDKDGDGYGTDCSKGSDCNDNDAGISPGKSETCNGIDDDCDGSVDEGVKNACGGCGDVPSESCSDGKDNDCDGSTDENCCLGSAPYFCSRTDNTCWLNQERCDAAIKCGGNWWACNDAEYNEKCVDSKPGCCLPEYPYFCPSTNTCFRQDGLCDGRHVYNCNSKLWVCLDKSGVGTCDGDQVRCCPSSFKYWWKSDSQCHASYEPQKCAVPDGSSAVCDCDTDSDCAKADASKPYCGETYGVRTGKGFHACLSEKPEYCGTGKCAGSENYNNCQTDCGQLAPKGTINVDVYYRSGANANKPISGASVSLDGVQKGATDGSGKKSFEAAYGRRNVKVECADRAFCGEKTVGVDGAEYVSFGCNCKSSVSFSSLRARFKAKTNAYPKGYPVANVGVFIDESFKSSSNQFGAVDIEGLTRGAHQLDVYLKLLEDGQEKIYVGGTFLTLSSPYEEKVYELVKGNSPSTAYVALENGNEAFGLTETNITPELAWIPIILAVVWIAGTVWDSRDYQKCVEKQATAWDPRKEDWGKFECNTDMNEDQLNDCVTKLLSKNQNTIESCDFQVAMLASNAIPLESYLKTGGKLAVRIGKAARIIPFIDDAAQGAYRTYRFVRNGEHFVTVTDKLNKGAKYVFKLADNILKIFDNSVGFIVNKVARNPETWKKISEKVDNLLLNTAPKDVPKEFLENMPLTRGARRLAVQGYLGERAGDGYITIAKETLEKNGAEVIIKKGKAGDVVFESQKYVAKYTDTGSGIVIINKAAKETAGELDGLFFVNGKPVIIESKAKKAVNFAQDELDKNKFFDRKVIPIEELTGQTPEVLLLVPKGEANGLLQDLGKLSTHLESKGSHLAVDEFPVTNQQFSDAAQRIVTDFNKHGR